MVEFNFELLVHQLRKHVKMGLEDVSMHIKNPETGSSSRIVKLEHKLSFLRGDGGTLFSCEPMMHNYLSFL